jgi:dihydrofolate reductase
MVLSLAPTIAQMRFMHGTSMATPKVAMPNSELVFKTDPVSAELIREQFRTIGANVTGRRTFDDAQAWGGRDPYGVPSFIVSHTIPMEWSGPDSPFTFVTDGVASAIAQAKTAAGNKDVAVAAASIAQQCLNLGLLDEIQIHLAPVLLGEGIRLFDHLSIAPMQLECTRVIEAPSCYSSVFPRCQIIGDYESESPILSPTD